MERLKEEIEWHFERFLKLIQEQQDVVSENRRYGEDRRVRVEKGRVYWRIWVDEHDINLSKDSLLRSHVFGFVRIKDGAILRAATWKAPETRTKSAVRGYVYDENVTDYFHEYGIRYAPAC